MPSFCAVLNCSNRADWEKEKSNYCFPSIVKNNDKEGLKLEKTGKVVSLNFQEIFNWVKGEKNKNKNQNNAFCLPFIGSFTQISQYQIWKANTYSILMVIQLGPSVLESSTRISKFHEPTDSEHKCHKTRIENWLFIGFQLGPPDCEPTFITTTPCSTYSMMGSIKLLYIHFQSLGTILETFHFLKKCKCSKHPHSASTVESISNKNQAPVA